jgi:N-formylglutamate amidohydrolase
MNSYKTAGFEVAYNWPYKGGRITQTYGQPQKGQHTVQVEMSRALYMDEATKQKKPEQILEVSRRLAQAIAMIINEIN